MNYQYLGYSISFVLGAYLYFRFHKWWAKGKENDSESVKPLNFVKAVKNWTVIVVFCILAIIYFFKSIL